MTGAGGTDEQVISLQVELAQSRRKVTAAEEMTRQGGRRIMALALDLDNARLALSELVAAAQEMLLHGEHEDGCDDGDDPCSLCQVTLEVREDVLRAAITRASELIPGFGSSYADRRKRSPRPGLPPIRIGPPELLHRRRMRH